MILSIAFSNIKRYNMNEKGPILWYCWFGIGSGYTSMSETMLPAMEELGYDVYINDGKNGTGEILTPYFNDLYIKSLKNIHNIDFTKVPQIMCWSMEYFWMLKGKSKIGWIFLESTKLPYYHVNSCNNMDYIVANSEWIKNVLVDSGVTVPIYNIIPCIHAPDFPERTDWRMEKPFVFLHNAFLSERKNPFQMLDGYISTFPDDGKTKFILCSQYRKEVEEMMLKKYRYRNDIEFIFSKHPFTREGSRQLFYRADCYVNISHGEGLSMPDMEAMSTGLPVIGSNWDSRGIYLDNEVGWMVKINGFTKAYTGMEDICGQWADYDTEDYTRLLKYVAEHPEEVRTKGRKAAKRIHKEFTPEKAALALDKMLQEVKYDYL
jgi:glycosyltransferase involved in cell wall biosynthesis